ncbi:MAG: HAD-IC family P-type ATPase, partial [Bacteroidales bacterium]|nr:HAD-IC family P-type ATPase [Bacteroidales bacterium]
MNDFYNREIDEVISILNTDKTSGLTNDEADRRLEETGYNQLTEKRRKSFTLMLLEQFKSFMIIVLLIAAIISGVVGLYHNEGLLDTFIILGILVINAFIGAFQERKAESSLEALKNMAAPMTRVLREGIIHEIHTRELVPGDIVILDTGSVIPADLRLTETVNLKIQEASLTGESAPVEKTCESMEGNDIGIGDRRNMAFSTGMVTYGRGRGVVVKTGMQTEVGRIAGMLQDAPETETPMSRRLNHLGKVLGIAALVICGLIFLVGVLYGNSVLAMFMTAVSLAVAAIPEGLPAVSTIVLAIGVQRMVKRHAIIRTLPSVETLGSATIICSDKTGTLTQNKMTVVASFVNHRKDIIDRTMPAAAELSEEERRLLMVSVLCADARLCVMSDGTVDYSGDPTETALLEFGVFYGLYKDKLENQFPRVAEIPFDSERKRMSTVNRMPEATGIRVNVKGGLEEILSICDRIILNGEIKAITDHDIDLIRKNNDEMA